MLVRKHVFNFGKEVQLLLQIKNQKILVPNDIPLNAEYTVQEITFERLLDVINKFGEVAKCSVEAGFDFLEFHYAHNYLPHSMLSSGINHRSNEWGRSFENQQKFPL